MTAGLPARTSNSRLASRPVFSHHSDVEDWEQFFEEKSRRRADKVRRRHHGRNTRRLGVAISIVAILACIVVLSR